VHAAAGRCAGCASEPVASGRAHRPGRGIRSGTGRRLLEGHRRAASEQERVQTLDPVMVRPAKRKRLCRLEEGRRTHAGLGRCRMTENALAAASGTGPPHGEEPLT
jgi:hypothetical protein